ncbi:MAG: hypothetical protein HY353_05345 [Candidatus Omnitrophica bacterium]|nr:hypothetical protein [Candidatus Omnitrophota bacterium]
MDDPLQRYREAIAKQVHAICWDRNLNPESTVDTEAACRIERFLPHLVEAAKMVGPNKFAEFEAVVVEAVCPSCGGRDAHGVCQTREAAECCLYRYLPLAYEAICGVESGPAGL